MGPRPMYNSSTMERRHRSTGSTGIGVGGGGVGGGVLSPNSVQNAALPIQPQDVALLLRPGRLLPYNQRTMSLGDAGIQRDAHDERRHSRSVEDLILTIDKDAVAAGNNQSVI